MQGGRALFNEKTRGVGGTVDYISLQDLAVDDEVLSANASAEYVKTGNLDLIAEALRKEPKPCRFHLAEELSPVARKYLFQASADPQTGEMDEAMLDGLLVAMGLHGWTNPPKGAPPWRTRRVGFHRLVAPEILDFIGPEVGAELALTIYHRHFGAEEAAGDDLTEEVAGNS